MGFKRVRCAIVTYHAGPPTVNEIRNVCGEAYTSEFLNTPACTSSNCHGLYLHLASSKSSAIKAVNDNPITPVQDLPQLTSTAVDTCSEIWRSQIPEELPAWLSIPESASDLYTSNEYYYLAGRLIANGIVNANNCESRGLRSNGYTNECGHELAKPVVLYWQNQFDQDIFNAARESGISAVLLKRLFAQESQFWPGKSPSEEQIEYNLGQITELGVDTLFIWNPAYYKGFCSLILSESACSKDYMRLNFTERALLRAH